MAFGSFERLLALRYLRARRREGFVSVVAIFSLVGIFLGVGTLIVVMSVMSGFRQELLGQILGVNGHLSVLGIVEPIRDYEGVAERIDSLPGVLSATPIVEGQVMATDDQGRATGALVRGMRPEDLKARKQVAENVVAGSLADFQGEDVVAIGSRLAQRFGITIGDGITLIAPEFTVIQIGQMPRIKTYRVIALFEVGMYEYDSSYVYMPLEAAQLFFRLKGQANAVEVFVEDPSEVTKLRVPIRRAAGREYRTVDWQGRQLQLLQRAADREDGDVPDPLADHHRRRLQYHLRPIHAGEGEGQGHRDPAHHGRHQRDGAPHLLPVGRHDRHSGNRAGRHRRRRLHLEHPDHPGLGGATGRHPGLRSDRLFPHPSCPRG